MLYFYVYSIEKLSNFSVNFFFDLWVICKAVISFPNILGFSRDTSVDFYFNFIMYRDYTSYVLNYFTFIET